MIRKIALLAALCALAAVTMASAASAVTNVRAGSGSGTLYSGAISASQSGTSSLTATDGSGTTVSCSSGGFAGSVGASGGASVSGSLTSLNFGPGCASNTFPQIDHCSLNSAGTVTATATSTSGGTMQIASISETCYTSGGTAICTFSRNTSFSGTVTNSNHAVAFTNIGVSSSQFGCPSTANFSGTFAPVQTDDGTHTSLWLTTA